MRHAVLGNEDEIFHDGPNTSCGLGCEAWRHARKTITCAQVSNARAHASGMSAVFTA